MAIKSIETGGQNTLLKLVDINVTLTFQLINHGGIHGLVASNDPIGYREGSYVSDYLIDELNIPTSRLVALKSEDESADALRKGPTLGGVAALVDLKGFAEVFLSTRCEFSIAGQEFTRSGWGFAFPRGSQLSIDMSTAILRLSEKGDLQRIYNKWLQRSYCSSQDTQVAVDTLQLNNFWGIYLVCGLACFLALIIYFIRVVTQFIRHHTPDQVTPTSDNVVSSPLHRVQTFLSFVGEKEEEIKRRFRNRQLEVASCVSPV